MKSGCEALENQWSYVDGTVRLPAAMQEWEERRGPSGPFDRYWSEICQNVERTGESKSLGCAHERHRVRHSRVDVLCISAARDTSQRSPSPRADLWGLRPWLAVRSPSVLWVGGKATFPGLTNCWRLRIPMKSPCICWWGLIIGTAHKKESQFINLLNQCPTAFYGRSSHRKAWIHYRWFLQLGIWCFVLDKRTKLNLRCWFQFYAATFFATPTKIMRATSEMFSALRAPSMP